MVENAKRECYMTLREQFEKHINIESLTREDALNHAMAWAYIQWLEEEMPIREKQAWDAARETDDGYPNSNLKYQSIEDWKEE